MHGGRVVAGYHVASATAATTTNAAAAAAAAAGSIAVHATQACQADGTKQGRCLCPERRELGGVCGWQTLKLRL